MNKVVYTADFDTFIEKYDRVTYKLWDELTGLMAEIRKHVKQHYLEEQGFRCAYCRMVKKERHGSTWDVEHILPKSLFPQFLFEPENLAAACKECNNHKDACQVLVSRSTSQKTYPTSSDAYLIMHPHYDKFSDHFELTEVEGKRRLRAKNGKKAKATYIACNFIRFDFSYGEWDSFNTAIMDSVNGWLDRCPSTATVPEVKRMVGHLQYEISADF